MLTFFKSAVTPGRKSLGAQGESLVQAYLRDRGFSIIKTNFSVRAGEVDIIALKDDVLVFVEVKTRTTVYFNTSEVVTLSKQKKIIFAAKSFIAKHTYIDKTYRFDVALVEGEQDITYIENAFCEGD